MIVYLDTSAVVPLLVAEAGSGRSRQLVDLAERLVVTRLVYVEAVAALSMARRLGRLTEGDLDDAVSELGRVWRRCSVRELDEDLMSAAAGMSRRFGLRGYDSIHCAAAVELLGDGAVAASGDRKLLRAWHELGLATVDTGPANS